MVIRAAILAAILGALTAPASAQTASGQPQSCQQLVAVLVSKGRVALDGVTFDVNRASLRPYSQPALIAARDVLLALGGDWQIAGHTDDRGSRTYNQNLSERQAMAVRDWLVGAGVPFGQMTAIGFGFDQPLADNATDDGRAQNWRVELVGTVRPDMLGFGGPQGVDPCPEMLTAGTRTDRPPPPPITEWTGSGSQDWLAFSYLMATGAGAGDGGVGDRLVMPSGTQPQACQALCSAQDSCAAFTFEPAGANFIETASCALINYGTEVTLRRDNGYLDGGVYHASGLKPDARLLTPESEQIALSLLADLAEIAALRDSVRLTAPDTQAMQTWMDVALDGGVPPEAYQSYLEIAELGDYAFDWQRSKSSLFVHDMADGRSGQIWVPEPGDYTLRYVINHPDAGLHAIAEQVLHVPAQASEAASGPAPQTAADGRVSLSFPMVVGPGESITINYTGPLHDGDWIEMISQGDDENMSGGLAWDWASGKPIVLTAPGAEGEYTLRYVAENPQAGRTVLASETLVVRAPAVKGIAPADILHRCEGFGMTPCDLVLPDHDIALTLLPGYGITEPYVYVTAGGVAADRPTFEVVRLSDGAPVVTVNARQVSAPYCQTGLAGDAMCVTSATGDTDGLVAAFVFGSLSSAAMLAEIEAMGEYAPGDLQGVWFVSFTMPGSVVDQAYFALVDLLHDAGDSHIAGFFMTSPDLGPLRDVSGDVEGTAGDGTISLRMLTADGTAGLVFDGTAFGDIIYTGQVALAHAPDDAPINAVLSKQAGPDEAWSGPPWMTGETDGTAAAMQTGQAAIGDMLGGTDGDDKAIAEIMGALMVAVAGAGAETAPVAVSPNLTDLGGRTVDLQGIPADALIKLIVPFQSTQP